MRAAGRNGLAICLIGRVCMAKGVAPYTEEIYTGGGPHEQSPRRQEDGEESGHQDAEGKERREETEEGGFKASVILQWKMRRQPRLLVQRRFCRRRPQRFEQLNFSASSK
jgi:hypothetical protein